MRAAVRYANTFTSSRFGGNPTPVGPERVAISGTVVTYLEGVLDVGED